MQKKRHGFVHSDVLKTEWTSLSIFGTLKQHMATPSNRSARAKQFISQVLVTSK